MSERKAVTKKLALKQALTLKVVKPRPPRKPIYGAAVITAVQGTRCTENPVRALTGRCVA